MHNSHPSIEDLMSTPRNSRLRSHYSIIKDMVLARNVVSTPHLDTFAALSYYFLARTGLSSPYGLKCRTQSLPTGQYSARPFCSGPFSWKPSPTERAGPWLRGSVPPLSSETSNARPAIDGTGEQTFHRHPTGFRTRSNSGPDRRCIPKRRFSSAGEGWHRLPERYGAKHRIKRRASTSD